MCEMFEFIAGFNNRQKIIFLMNRRYIISTVEIMMVFVFAYVLEENLQAVESQDLVWVDVSYLECVNTYLP